MREALERHRTIAATLAFLVVAGAITVLVWFQPQKLFIDAAVREPAPTGAPQVGGPVTVTAGRFESLEHDTTGNALLQRGPDGSHTVRLETLRTSNGPDLRVYLSKLPKGLGRRDYGREFVELGRLKGNIGDQNYAVPAGTDVSQFTSVVIWCARFNVGFGVAQFT